MGVRDGLSTKNLKWSIIIIIIYLLLLTAIELSLGGSSPYTTTDKESFERKILI